VNYWIEMLAMMVGLVAVAFAVGWVVR